MPLLPTGTVTFLFTDIEGSTPLWEREPDLMRQALQRHDTLLRQAIEAQGGHLYKVIGDAMQAAFEQPGPALAAAIAAQRALTGEPWPTSAPIRVRMGLHLGPAEASGTDYATTHTLNRVARVMAAAHGGQVVVSRAVTEVVREQLPEGLGLHDLGQHRLKGLSQLEQLFQVQAPDLPADFPPLASLDIRRHNLPPQLTTFIGREQEIAAVTGLLSNARLVTLTGPGGAGKTRLALHAAASLSEALPDGAWLVELAPVADPSLVLPTVATALSLREQPGLSLPDALTDYLQGRALLLVLDNCEHLVAACAQAVEAVLRAGARVRVLATSREALGVPGETAFRVPSLSLPASERGTAPETVAGLAGSEAVRLFVDRARAALPDFALSAQNAAAVAQICRRLDGIPLALELAASRVRLLRVEQIAARLDDRFRLLTGGSRSALPRQQTLRALIDWSYDLLAAHERTLLQHLSVFAGGWSLEAAEAIGRDNVLDTLATLVDKSLVNVTRAAGEEARYTLLETIRQYANEKLVAAGAAEAAAVRERHLAYFIHFAEAVQPRLFGPEEDYWLEQLEREHDNLRAALGWGLETDVEAALRLSTALYWFWERRAYGSEARRWLDETVARVEALPAPASPEANRRRQRWLGIGQMERAGVAATYGDIVTACARAEASMPLLRQGEEEGALMVALSFASVANLDLGHLEQAQAFSEAAQLMRPLIGEKWLVPMALHWLSQYVNRARGDYTTGRALMLESIRLFREMGSAWGAALSQMGLGFIADEHGDHAEAERWLRVAMEAARAMGDRFRANQSRSVLAHIARHKGDVPAALALYREAIVEWLALSQLVSVAELLEFMGYLAVNEARPQRAARLLGAAEARREVLQAPLNPSEHAAREAALAGLAALSGPDNAAADWELGRAMTLDEAVSYATEI
jgi:predicted ATPase/class 3 adenylate cyclase